MRSSTVLPRLSLLSLALAAAAPSVHAAEGQAEPTTLDAVTVTGTRTQPRTVLGSPVPIDVLSAEDIRASGYTDTSKLLQALVPSFNFPHPTTPDGNTHIRSATLRGLSPDQTLVLVNGKRRHTSAWVNTGGTVGKGAVSTDLNAIPVGAIERIEILRDGASAQYGSDAIAGVINLRLKEAREGGGASVTYGQYFTTVKTARGERDETDGRTVTASAWQGLGLGSDGFLTLSAEYLNREPTNRSDLDPRVTPNAVTARLGDPKVEQWTVFANAGKPLAADNLAIPR